MTTRTKISTHFMLERLIFIDSSIGEGRYPNTSVLANELEVSVPTISRDIAMLRDRLGAPIEYDRDRNGFYYTRPYNLAMLFFHNESV